MIDKTFIIAELGINHNGSVKLCKEMIFEARNAGADAVKLQILTPRKISCRAEIVAAQEKANLEIDQLMEVKRYSQDLGIEIFSSIGDIDSVNRFRACGFQKAKVSSSNVLNFPLHEELVRIGCPVILSTGDCEVDEIREVVELYQRAAIEIVVLYCVPRYPTEPGDVCLDAIRFLGEQCRTAIGFSDHTRTLEAAVAAVGAGARVIEKHLTLDSSMDGPDHQMSLEPYEFKELVSRIRVVDQMLGPADLYFQNEVRERIKDSPVRRSIVMLEDRNAGYTIQESDVVIARPRMILEDAIHPRNYRSLIGRTLKQSISSFTPICPGDLYLDSSDQIRKI